MRRCWSARSTHRFGATAALLVTFLASEPSVAHARGRGRIQLPPQYVSVAVGYGLSAAYDEPGRGGDGFFAEGVYMLVPSAWFSPRAYAGTVITFGESDAYCRDAGVTCNVSAKIGYLGAKGRLSVPIPFVAPFFELGLGASIGAMDTKTLAHDESLRGITYHIPVALGLSLGEDHDWDIALAYLFHPTEKQFDGAFALGLRFRVD